MIPTGVSMVVSGGAVSPENRSNEEKVAALARWLDFQFESPAIGNQVRAIGAALAAVERERDSLADLADELQEQDERNLAEMSENARLLARIAAVEAKAERLRGYAEQYLYDGDSDQPLPGYVEVYGAADELSALAASPTPTGPEPECNGSWTTCEKHAPRSRND